MSQNELLAKLAEIKELKALQENIAGQIEALEDAVKAEMTVQGFEKLTIGTFKVSYIKFKTNRFDTKTFKAEHEAMYNQYIKTTEARRFTIN